MMPTSRATKPSLWEARVWLRRRLAKGAECPCCEQFAKIYRRRLDSGVTKTLLLMWKHSKTDWVDVKREIPQAGNGHMGMLNYWGFVERAAARNGVWRITPAGEQFLLGHTTTPSHAEIYNGKLQRLSGDQINVKDALGSKFDYDELMLDNPANPEEM